MKRIQLNLKTKNLEKITKYAIKHNLTIKETINKIIQDINCDENFIKNTNNYKRKTIFSFLKEENYNKLKEIEKKTGLRKNELFNFIIEHYF